MRGLQGCGVFFGQDEHLGVSIGGSVERWLSVDFCLVVACLCWCLVPARLHAEYAPDASPQEFVESEELFGRQRPALFTPPAPSRSDIQQPWWKRDTAFGAWDQMRPWLRNHGITLGVVYSTEVFSNVKGGRSTRNATKVLGNLDMTLALDTEQLGLWQGGTLLLYGQNLSGQTNGLNPKVGPSFVNISDLNAPEAFIQMSSYVYTHEFLDGRMSVSVGKHDTGDYFLVSDVSAAFQNGGENPPNLPMPTFPNPTLGFVLFLDPLDWLSFAAGVYGGSPDGESFGDGGLLSGDTFSIYQFILRPTLRGHIGSYRAGAWLLTQDTAEVSLTADPLQTYDHNFGFYLLFDQEVYQEAATSVPQGLEVFFSLSWVPSDRNRANLETDVGFIYTGLLPHRPYDKLGGNVENIEVTHRLRAAGLKRETILELFYRLQLTPWLSVQPDVQYYVDPGGRGNNALVLGLRTVVVF